MTISMRFEVWWVSDYGGPYESMRREKVPSWEDAMRRARVIVDVAVGKPVTIVNLDSGESWKFERIS